MTELITTWQRFAEVTIKTNDLDPMYEVIYQLNKTKDRTWTGNFIMTFLLYYNAGEAAHIADNMDDPKRYWEVMQWMAKSDPQAMKRGTERRHFRGENERKALEKLASFGMEPWELLVDMYSGFTGNWTTPTYDQFYKYMTSKYAGTQFGPYFIWKLYDIFNVCLGMPISLSFAEAGKYMPDEPRKAAEHFFPTFEHGLFQVLRHIEQFDHPVVPGRKCGLAEAETVLCMMKGFFKTKKHYIGDDIIDKYMQLKDYPDLRGLLPPLINTADYTRGELK